MNRPAPVLLVGFMGLAASGVLAACDGANPLDTLCCSDFDVGADLSGVDFEADVTFNAWIQAVADFSGVASAMVSDVSASCKAMAIDISGDDTLVANEPSDPTEQVAYWCTQAKGAISAAANGAISITVQPPRCSASFSAQAKCEGSCDVSGGCDPGSVEARCTGGELSVKCEGQCSGSCQGSANLAVECSGACEGTCEGTCDGSTMMGGGACMGTCEGTCRGTCTMEANAMVECSGQCSGGCMGTATAPKCEGTVDPPSCDLDADCQASCEASAEAKAECVPPAIEIVASGNLSVQALGSIKTHLPAIFLAAEARAKGLAAAGGAIFDISAKLDPGSLSGKAALCVVPAASAIGAAIANAEAGLSASLDVAGAFSVM
ncbi:MAG: hypothetical protein KC731_28795 [Myxococcales bacterium]|nr:hypothetical protein [Myxococcales bacterium]